jgi:hypothetical protein
MVVGFPILIFLFVKYLDRSQVEVETIPSDEKKREYEGMGSFTKQQSHDGW